MTLTASHSFIRPDSFKGRPVPLRNYGKRPGEIIPDSGYRPIANYTVKKRLAVFPSPAGTSLTKLSLAGNNLINPGQEEVDK
jgi:hypothetical protein